MTTPNAPSREVRMQAWLVLMRQSDYLGQLAERWKYGKHADGSVIVDGYAAARVAQREARALREVADWLQEITEK